MLNSANRMSLLFIGKGAGLFAEQGNEGFPVAIDSVQALGGIGRGELWEREMGSSQAVFMVSA